MARWCRLVHISLTGIRLRLSLGYWRLEVWFLQRSCLSTLMIDRKMNVTSSVQDVCGAEVNSNKDTRSSQSHDCTLIWTCLRAVGLWT
jgi:hypothetical protein